MAIFPIHQECESLIATLYSLENLLLIQNQQRFGIFLHQPIGVRIFLPRNLAKGHRDHFPGQVLWETGIHEARILDSQVGNPGRGLKIESLQKGKDET
jgi:hypothetical protein